MPTIDLVELETEPMMNVASTETGGAGVGNKPVGGNTPDLSGSNRGTWGDCIFFVLTTLANRGPQGTTFRRATCDHPLLMLSKLRFLF